MSPEEELRRAEAAERMEADPLFAEAKARVFADLAELRRRAGVGDDKGHSRLILMEQLANRFFDFFAEAVQTGHMARRILEERRTFAERMRSQLSAYVRLGRNL